MAADDALLAELAALYRDADAQYGGWGCAVSTECCRFGTLGREPYVTSIEEAALRRAIARRGGPLSARRRALPVVDDERTCPMLARDGRCSVYADRPLGCRTFFCERALPAGPAPSRAALADLVRRLRDLAARHRPGGDAGRPLGRLGLEPRASGLGRRKA
jgi:hypothetical protein